MTDDNEVNGRKCGCLTEEHPCQDCTLIALEEAIKRVCDEDTQNAISDEYRRIIGDSDSDSDGGE